MDKDDDLDEWELERFNITEHKNYTTKTETEAEKQKADLKKQKKESIW